MRRNPPPHQPLTSRSRSCGPLHRHHRRRHRHLRHHPHPQHPAHRHHRPHRHRPHRPRHLCPPLLPASVCSLWWCFRCLCGAPSRSSTRMPLLIGWLARSTTQLQHRRCMWMNSSYRPSVYRRRRCVPPLIKLCQVALPGPQLPPPPPSTIHHGLPDLPAGARHRHAAAAVGRRPAGLLEASIDQRHRRVDTPRRSCTPR